MTDGQQPPSRLHLTPLIRALVGVTLAAVSAACVEGPTRTIVVPASMRAVVLNVAMGIGTEKDLLPFVREPDSGLIPTGGLSWSVSNPAVLQIDAVTGRARALAKGDAVVTVRRGAEASTAVQFVVNVVGEAAATVKDVEVTPRRRHLVVGERVTLRAAVRMPDGQINANVVWSSSDDTVAVINPTTGEVQALRVGQVTLVAAYAVDPRFKGLADATVVATEADMPRPPSPGTSPSPQPIGPVTDASPSGQPSASPLKPSPLPSAPSTGAPPAANPPSGPVVPLQARIKKVTSDTPDGTYGEEDVIAIRVEFDQALTVAGTPLLSLNTGSARAWHANMTRLEDLLMPTVRNGRAVYSAAKSDPGRGILVFEYEVQAGDFTDRNQNQELQLDTTAVLPNLGLPDQVHPVVILPPGARVDGKSGAANLELPVNGADGKPLENSLAGGKEIRLATPDYPTGYPLPDLVFGVGSDTGRAGEADTLTDRVTRDNAPGMVVTNVPAGSELRVYDYLQVAGRIEWRRVHVEQAPTDPPYGVGWTPGATPGFLTRTLDWSAITGAPQREGGFTSVGPLADGPHHLVAQVRIADPADATRKINSPRSALPVAIDTTAPAAPTVALADASDTGPRGDGNTSAAVISVVGRAEPGAAISVRLSSTEVAKGVVDDTGLWSATLTQGLADGTYVLDAYAIDRAGNASRPGSFTLRINRR